MIFIGNFNTNSFISVTKQKTLLSLLKHMCREMLLCFYGDFCMNLYFVDSDEAMKRDDEALNASSLQFLRSVKRFTASSLQIFAQC
jgi:hypothetical protein